MVVEEKIAENITEISERRLFCCPGQKSLRAPKEMCSYGGGGRYNGQKRVEREKPII